MRPVQAVLAVSVGEGSAWALGSKLQAAVAQGCALTPKERANVVLLADTHAEEGRLLVVFKDLGAGLARRLGQKGRPDARKIAETFRQQGRWDELLDLFDHPRELRLEVGADLWKSVLRTTEKGLQSPEERAKERTSLELDKEVAEAVCLCTWGLTVGAERLQEEKRKLKDLVKAGPKEARQALLGKP